MLLVTYNMTKLNFLASKSAMSNPQPACPVKGFVQPSLGFRRSKNILHTDNLSLLWYWHFWCRWSSVPLYDVCYHCS